MNVKIGLTRIVKRKKFLVLFKIIRKIKKNNIKDNEIIIQNQILSKLILDFCCNISRN